MWWSPTEGVLAKFWAWFCAEDQLHLEAASLEFKGRV